MLLSHCHAAVPLMVVIQCQSAFPVFLPAGLMLLTTVMLLYQCHAALPLMLLIQCHCALPFPPPSSLMPFCPRHAVATVMLYFHCHATVYREIYALLNFYEFREFWQIVKFSFAKFHNVGVARRA